MSRHATPSQELAVTLDQGDYDALKALAFEEHKRRANGGAGGMFRAFCSCGMPHSGRGTILCELVRHCAPLPENSHDASPNA